MLAQSPQFTTSPIALAEAAASLITEMRTFEDGLVQEVDVPNASFANVILPLAHVENKWILMSNTIRFYSSVSADDKLRDGSRAANVLLQEFRTGSLMRQDIFKLITAVREKEEEALGQEPALLLERTYQQRLLTVVGIADSSKRDRFKAIQKRLSKVSTTFQENVNNDESHVRLQIKELEGVPQKILSQLEKTESDDEYEVYLADYSHMQVLSYATSPATRRKLYQARNNRCSENISLLKEAVLLRHEAASLLGFADHASLQLQDKLPKKPEVVLDFLADLRSKLSASGTEAFQRLQNFKKEKLMQQDNSNNIEDDEFHLWDYDFYKRLMFEEVSSVDTSRIREYFTIQNSINGMMELFSQLFSIEFTEIRDDEKEEDMAWHKDVQLFAVHESRAKGGDFLGHLFLDLYSRSGKSWYPSCHPLFPVSCAYMYYRQSCAPLTDQKGFVKQDGSRQYPATALICSFPKPLKDGPSLFGHYDTVVMFHELGHGIHDLVSKTRFARFHGPEGVAPDFGELPIQLLEQWFWIPSQIKSFRLHYSYLSNEMFRVWQEANPGADQPEKHMPDELVEAILNARYFHFGPLFYLDQLQKAQFDMEIHMLTPNKIETLDLGALWCDLAGRINPMNAIEPDHIGHVYAVFTHLMQKDYAAVFYSYLL